MKMLTGLVALVLSFASVASTGETKTFTYDGTQNSAQLLLQGEKTHTEYRTETRTTTCYRTEIAGYQTICTGGYGGGYPGGGYPGPGRGYPYPGGGYGGGYRSCYQQPVYRQVAYACTQTVQVPFEVKDYDVQANVLVDVTKLSEVTTPGEKFVVALQGDTVTMTAVGSKKFLLVLKKQDLRGRMSGSVKYVDGLFAVEMIEAAPVLKALDLTSVSIEDSVLSFTMGPIDQRKYIGFALKVIRRRDLNSDITLFNRELDVSEVAVNATSVSSDAEVNVETLGVKFPKGKYTLTPKAFFKADGTMLNASQFGDDLVATRSLLFKVR